MDSIRTKLTEEIDCEVCPYGDSGNGIAAAVRRSTGYYDSTGGAAACSDRSFGAFGTGRNRAVKTNRLVKNTSLKKSQNFFVYTMYALQKVLSSVGAAIGHVTEMESSF